MRCEACGYQFLLASSTKCPDCGDLREAIVPELKRMGDSAFLPADVYDPGPVTRYVALKTPNALNCGEQLHQASSLSPSRDPEAALSGEASHPLFCSSNEDATQAPRPPLSNYDQAASPRWLAATQASRVLLQPGTQRSAPNSPFVSQLDLVQSAQDYHHADRLLGPSQDRALSTQRDEQLSFCRGQRHGTGRTDRPLEDVPRQGFGEPSDGSGPRRSSHTLRSSPDSLPCGIVSGLDTDATPFDQVADITVDMFDAGQAVLTRNDYKDAADIYRAMVAIAPTNAVPIMDSTVGLKAANAHLARRVAELEADKSRRDIVAQNITPAAGLPPLGAEAWFETAMAYRAEIEDLTRQLAAQALAHAEQMEGAQRRIAGLETQISMQDSIYADRPGTLFSARQKIATERDAALARVAELEGKIDCLMIECGALKREHDWERKARHEAENQLAMRVTPATPPEDAQQTAGDVKTTQEPKAFPAGALKTGGSDPRRMGPQ